MPRLSDQAKLIIQNNKESSLSKIRDEICKQTGIKYSRETIRKFRMTLLHQNGYKFGQSGQQNISRKKTSVFKEVDRTISKQLTLFSQVINSIHINANPNQRKLLKKICGGYDILTVREWIITRFTESLMK
ncbi:MAG: hypothetical protein ACXABG_02755 [Promethearchaeota archaeon]|jgi:hypothetical protein